LKSNPNITNNMKRTLLSLVLGAFAVTGWAQGTVDFRNFGVTFITPADRSVYFMQVGGTKLNGTNYVVALYYLDGAGRGAELDALGGELALNPNTAGVPTATLRLPNTATDGAWNTIGQNNRVLAGVLPLESATLQVRCWDITRFASYQAAIQGGGIAGASRPFDYTVPASGSPANQYYMDGLRAFAVVPEPSVIALGVLGLGGMLLLRRKKA
jgi:hypothetical protein